MNDRRWRPDGWGTTARIGVIAPHADIGPDAELSAMVPAGVSIHATRVFFGGMAVDRNMDEPIAIAPLRAYVFPPLLDDAVKLLAGGPLSVIAYAFTSTSYLGGDGDDAVLRERLQRRSGGIPVITTGAAALDALRLLGVRRVALIHPPWIAGDLNRLGEEYLRRSGFDIAMVASAELPGGQLDVTPEGVFDWTVANVPDDADGIFFGGNGFRVVGVIEQLEATLDRPVVSANQSLLWGALRACRVETATVRGYGRIFALPD